MSIFKSLLIASLMFSFISGFLFIWWRIGLRKMYYGFFRRKQIEQVYDFRKANEFNSAFVKFSDRIEQYIKKGFFNATIIELAEKRFDRENKIEEVRNFISDVVQKGYSVKEARKLALHNEFNKRIIKLAFKLNKKEYKKYGTRQRQVSGVEGQVGSTPTETLATSTTSNSDTYVSYGTRAGRTGRTGEPRANGTGTGRTNGAGRVSGYTRANGRTGIEPRRVEPNRADEPRRNTRNATTSTARTTTQRGANQGYPRTSTNSQTSRQRNIPIRVAEKPSQKPRYFG